MPAVLRLCHTRADEESMDNFRLWLRANNCGERTIEDRCRVVDGFARTHPGFPHVPPGQITAWLGRPGYTQWTRGAYYGHLRSYLTFALDAGIVKVDPMARMRRPKSGKSVPRPLTPAQVETVLAAANPNVRAWLTLGLYAGLRAHEIAKIRGQDVEEDQLWVLGKGGEGVYLPTHPAIWALAQTRPRQGWWFPTCSTSGHVRSTGVTTMTSRLFAANGIEGSIHRCRHTFATRLLRAGVNIRVVQELMRHASLASTMLYTEVTRVEMLDGINLLAA